jgi:exodeoxyribonuclease VII large subunit
MQQADLFSRVYWVSELLAEVSSALSSGWRRIAVAGEACEVKHSTPGHIYFSLKDETAKLSAVMWRSDAIRLPFRLEEGMEIVVTGTLTLYAARGQFQIQVAAIQPVGVGALQLAFEQLKRRLAAEGLFESARKRKLPFLPRRIGIVTSPSGAAIRDILHVLKRRHPDLAITIFPARVQGEGAALELVEGIEYFSRRPGFDVLLLTRGGGSAEDLAPFNDERLARALAASRIATISAVGHETDWTIVDYVADLRAPTPSAAAEMMVGVKQDISRRVAHSGRTILQIARRRLAEMRSRLLSAARSEAFAQFPLLVQRRFDRVAAARDGLESAIARAPEACRARLDQARLILAAFRRWLRVDLQRETILRLRERLAARMDQRTAAARGSARRAAEKLAALNPFSILNRGYAVVFAENRATPLTDPRQVRVGEDLRIRLARGSLAATVRRIFEEEK